MSGYGEFELDEDYQFYLDANSSNDGLGMSLGGGNIDGDGYDDLIIGAPYDDDEADNGGCVFIVLGQSGIKSSFILGRSRCCDGRKIYGFSGCL